MREAVDGFAMYGIRALEHWALRYLAEFLRSRGRDDEAVVYEERRAALAPSEHRADRLSRRVVRRLADHRRRPLEALERVAQRLGAQRALAVGEMLRLVAVRVRDVAEVDVERRARLEHVVRRLERRRERIDVGVRAVARRVHVREVEHRPDEVDLRRDREHVVERPELAHASHHLDAERHEPVLRLEPLAQVAELVDDVGDRALALAAEQEAGVEDDHLGAGGLREAGRVVEHAERHLELLLPRDMAHERGERRVHRERRCPPRAAPRRAPARAS